MKVIRDLTSEVYSLENRKHGNCFTVIDNDNVKFYYEFIITRDEALIKTKSLLYINEAINEFRFYNLYITKFYNESRSFYKSFDEVFSFKLPINIIQVSQFFLSEEKIEKLSDLSLKQIYIPVTILNDEYVCVDGHHRLYQAFINDCKMVNVYIDKQESYIQDFVYLAKENKIFRINDLEILTKEEYEEKWIGFCNQYFSFRQE